MAAPAHRGTATISTPYPDDLFCGSDAGGQRAACVYTIVESAKMCGINPQAYLADVLERIADHPINKIDALLPWLWTQ
jgi:transposase